jgi:hypothetical protein
MWYKHKPIGGSSEEISMPNVIIKHNGILKAFFYFQLFCSVQEYKYMSNETKFFVQIDFSGIKNWNTSSVLPFIINEIKKCALPLQ